MSRSVLIVDDHAGFRECLRNLLEEEGFVIVGEVEDGSSAVAAARELTPDAVVLDVQLPDLDGFEVARRLGADGAPPAVVLVSTRDVSDYGDLTELPGVVGFSGPTLKEGLTRKEWDRGNLPVVPYPAANRGLGQWSYVQYSYTKTIGLEVFLFPKPGSGWSALTADVEVVKGRDGRWLVDYWMPKKFHGPPAVAAKTKSKVKKAKAAVNAKEKRKPTRQAAPEPPADVQRGGLWWLLPLGLLSLAVVLPLSIGLVVWYRNRKAEREYLRSVGR